MRPLRELKNISARNKVKHEQHLKQKEIEEKNIANELLLKEEKKQEELKKEQRELNKKELKFLTSQKQELLTKMANFKNPVHVNFSNTYEVASVKYKLLKDNTEKYRESMLDSRENVLSNGNIFLLKLSATILFVFIITRIVMDNEQLLESLTYVTLFYPLFENMTGIVLDFILQDIVLISACAFFVSIVFRNSKLIYSNDIIKYSSISLLISIAGLLLSSVLYSL